MSHDGSVAYHAGFAAECSVEREYLRRGDCIAQRRWRGQAGEIDLIVHSGETLVFVEVKKSRTFDQAAQRLSRRQIARICCAAEEYAATQPMGLLSDMRFDAALVDGSGYVHIIENGFQAD